MLRDALIGGRPQLRQVGPEIGERARWERIDTCLDEPLLAGERWEDRRGLNDPEGLVTPDTKLEILNDFARLRHDFQGHRGRLWRKIQRLSTSDSPVEHIVFSDGLATISVFVEELKDKADSLEGFTAVGAVNTYSRLNDKYQVTVVGEVPPLTVRQIAGSVVLATNH